MTSRFIRLCLNRKLLPEIGELEAYWNFATKIEFFDKILKVQNKNLIFITDFFFKPMKIIYLV